MCGWGELARRDNMSCMTQHKLHSMAPATTVWFAEILPVASHTKSPRAQTVEGRGQTSALQAGPEGQSDCPCLARRGSAAGPMPLTNHAANRLVHCQPLQREGPRAPGCPARTDARASGAGASRQPRPAKARGGSFVVQKSGFRPSGAALAKERWQCVPDRVVMGLPGKQEGQMRTGAGSSARAASHHGAARRPTLQWERECARNLPTAVCSNGMYSQKLVPPTVPGGPQQQQRDLQVQNRMRGLAQPGLLRAQRGDRWQEKRS